MVRIVSAVYALAVVTANYQTFDYDYGPEEDPSKPRNLIMMVPDGTSPNVFTMARTVLDPTLNTRLHIDDLLMGSVRTSSNTSFVTDSAASATAYSTGFKTYDRAIAMDVNHQPIGTILEAAKAKGMVVGMIVTSRVTHATPACFASHIDYRDKEEEIAAQYVANKNLDFLLGGGQKFFTEDQFQHLEANGYSILHDADDLNTYVDENSDTGHLKVFGLFAKSHLAFEVDRHRTNQPSLSESVEKVLKLLQKNPQAQKNGFFMLIEGSRIDHAGHSNDAGAMAHDAIEFDRTVGKVKEFLANSGTNTAVVSAADHGTGGMTLGRNGKYAWDPLVLKRTTMSTELMYDLLEDALKACKNSRRTRTCEKRLELQAKIYARASNGIDEFPADRLEGMRKAIDKLVDGTGDMDDVTQQIAWAISDAAAVGWTTGGHVGCDVNLYCSGPRHFERMCKGAHDNTYVNTLMREYLKVNLQEQTLHLRGMQLNL